ncbi:hypothetical protein [Streptomyces sp. NPDC023588]|uniref:hypothetical protein n=1 Tax=Streptomyces sp. NPDC023588 TaxID=3154907 RepID=UPI0033E46472
MTRDGERLAGRTAERPVERRLRQALDARADGIDIRQLRPADPPRPPVRRLPVTRLRRFALPLAALAAAAAGVGYLLLAPAPQTGPVPPATPPRITAPAASPDATPSTAPPRPTPGTDTPGTPEVSSRPSRSAPPSPTTSPKPSRPVTPSASVPPSAGPPGGPGGATTSSPSASTPH